MIKRIQKIDDAGAFQSWKADPQCASFANVSLIYGSNGSGKSTLARALAAGAAGAAAERGLVVDIADSGESGVRRVERADDPFWSRVRVFNQDYVDRNLSFTGASDVGAAPLLVLGETRIDRANELEQARERLTEIDSESATAATSRDTAEKSARKLLTDCAREIAAVLGMVDGYAARSYNAASVRKVLSSGEAELASVGEDDLEPDLQLLRSPPPSALGLPEGLFSVTDLCVAIEGLRRRQLTVVALQALVDDPAAARWVQDGLPLHNHREDCLFCGGAVSADRRVELQHHFDESLTQLQQDIDVCLVDLDARRTSLASCLQQLAPDDAVAASARAEYQRAASRFRAGAEQVNVAIEALSATLKSKRENPFTTPSAPTLPEALVVDTADIVKALERHNVLCEDHTTQVHDAAKRVERAHVARIEDAHGKHRDNVTAIDEKARELETERTALQRRIEELNQTELDALPLASELTNELASLLGRTELAFEFRDDRYAITRDGQVANDLSEGERTAISLLYFLASLRDHTAGGQELVVVIDDPVTSLDGSVMHGVSAHLWGRLVHGRTGIQVILLTHSFELFRLWSIQLQRRHRDPSKLDRHSIHEIRMRSEADASGARRRVPRFIDWPTDQATRRRLQSEYHYLFWRLADSLEQCKTDDAGLAEMDAIAVSPNVARKLLEGFYSFRSPSHVGELQAAALRNVSEVQKPQRLRLLQFLNEGSHNQSADIGRAIEPGEAATVLSLVFATIQQDDPDHFTAMCESLRLAASHLVSATAMPGDPLSLLPA